MVTELNSFSYGHKIEYFPAWLKNRICVKMLLRHLLSSLEKSSFKSVVEVLGT